MKRSTFTTILGRLRGDGEYKQVDLGFCETPRVLHSVLDYYYY